MRRMSPCTSFCRAAAVIIEREIVDGLILAALVGTILPYAVNIASFVGLRIYRDDVTPALHAPDGLFTAAIAFGFLTLLAFRHS